MKKVININFQGQVIAIEETAYEMLKRYIENLKNYFSREEGGDEIVNDIENRIAELFGNRLRHGINVITDEDVDTITSSIGKPEDFDSDFEETQKENFSSESKQSMSPPIDEQTNQQEGKSLYRDSNDKMIAGVCSGLANYFKIDPVWMRLIFVVFFSVLFFVYILLWIILKPVALESNIAKRLYRNPNDKIIAGVCGGIAAYFKIDSWIPRLILAVPLLFSLIGVASLFPLNFIFGDIDIKWGYNWSIMLIYIVLWMIVPQATTVKQKVEMMGEKDYIKSIRETVSDNVASVKSKEESNMGAASSQSINTVGNIEKDASNSNRMNVGNLPPEPPKYSTTRTTKTSPSNERSGCLNAILVFFKIILGFAATIICIVMIAVAAGLIFANVELAPIKSLFINQGYESSLMWMFVILAFALPVVAMVIWLIRRAGNYKAYPVLGWITLVLWIVGIVAGGMLATRVAGKYKEVSYTEKNIHLSPFKGDKLYVDRMNYSGDFYSFNAGFGSDSEIDDLPYYSLNQDSLLFHDINIQLTKSRDSLFHVALIGASTERDLKVAKDNTQDFRYEIQQNDSVLLLPEFFSTPIKQGFRLQSMIVEIAVPEGKKIEIDDSLDDYDRGIRPDKLVKKLRKSHRDLDFQYWDSNKEYIMQQGELKSETDTETDTESKSDTDTVKHLRNDDVTPARIKRITNTDSTQISKNDAAIETVSVAL